WSFHDPRSGLLTGTIEPSGLVTTNFYDTFFRPVETRVSSAPNTIPDVWRIKYEYRLDGIANGVSGNSVRVLKNNALNGDPGLESWTYTDGLGRTVQSRTEADPQQGMTTPFRVVDTAYNARSQPKYTTLPYFEEGSGFIKEPGVKSSGYNEY